MAWQSDDTGASSWVDGPATPYVDEDPLGTSYINSDWFKQALAARDKYGTAGVAQLWNAGRIRPPDEAASRYLSTQLQDWQGYEAHKNDSPLSDPIFMAALTAVTGGMIGPLLGGGMLGAMGAGAVTGGIRGLQSGNSSDVLRGAVTGAAGGGAGNYLGGIGGETLDPSGLTSGDTSSILNGTTTAGGSLPTAVGNDATTTTPTSSGGDEHMWDWLDEISTGNLGSFDPGGNTLWSGDPNDPMSALANDVGSFDPGGDLTSGGGPTMPGAKPEADPTFGGVLTQTGDGQFEDLSKFGIPGVNNMSDLLSNPFLRQILSAGRKVINGGTSGKPGGSTGGTGTGGLGGDGTFGGDTGTDLLGLGLGMSPFLLSLGLAKSQGGDIDSRIRNIEGINSPFAKAMTDPYDLETGYGRAGLQTDLGLRGVEGSSFGNQALTNYDTTRGMGRSDILSKALMSGYTTALGAKVANNKNTNDLVGRGLLATANLFSPKKDPFGLQQLIGTPP